MVAGGYTPDCRPRNNLVIVSLPQQDEIEKNKVYLDSQTKIGARKMHSGKVQAASVI